MNRVSSMSRAELVRELIEPVHPTTVPDGQAACSTSRGADPNFSDDATVAQLVEHKLAVARELLMRDLYARMKSGPVLSSPEAVREWLILHCAKLEREVFIVLHLDVRGRLIAAEEMFRGGLTECVVHIREVVKSALERNAASLILAHFHPSGDSTPSPADHLLTANLKAALNLIDVRVDDHFIVGGASALSFAEQGLL